MNASLESGIGNRQSGVAEKLLPPRAGEGWDGGDRLTANGKPEMNWEASLMNAQTMIEAADALHGPRYEQLLTPSTVLDFLSDHVGAVNGLTARECVQAICGFATAQGERHLRQIVVELRRAGHPVCATPGNGYFLAADDAELEATCEFLLDRAMTSLTQIGALRRVALPDLRGQLGLPLKSRGSEVGNRESGSQTVRPEPFGLAQDRPVEGRAEPRQERGSTGSPRTVPSSHIAKAHA